MNWAQSKENFQVPKVGAKLPEWSSVAPYFMSAVLYLTALGALLAPLPLLSIYFRKGRGHAFAATAVNGLLVFYLGGPVRFLIYLTTVLTLTWVIAESSRRKLSVEKSACIAFLGVVGVAGLVIAVWTRVFHEDLVRVFHSYWSEWLKLAGKPSVPDSKFFNVEDFEEWRRGLWELLPAVAQLLMIMIWTNISLVIKSNPGGIRELLGLEPNFLSHWKAPEFLVWPTIVTGFFLIVDLGLVSDLSWVVFELLMLVYSIQGLSILSSVLDLWGIRGLVRVIGYSVSLVLMFPLVVTVGFFDLWFDFRGKFRQS